MRRFLSSALLVVRRNLRQHALSSCVTAASVALAAGLVMAVFAVTEQSRAAFAGGSQGFDAVLGARGSQLQLVLNSVFHLETSPGNLPWSSYAKLRDDPRVELAIPYAVGDNYRGFRIVGTDERIFETLRAGDGGAVTLRSGGRVFDPARREAVVGDTAARSCGLSVGATFHPSHGVEEAVGGETHEEEYVVVGVLEPTGTPTDRVIWIPIEGIFRMGGHELHGSGEAYEAKAGEAIADEHKEVSAVMLRLSSPRAGRSLHEEINQEGRDATLAWPIGASVLELFDKLGWMNRVLEVVAYLVVLVAAGSILASLYNTMNERRREFAILRALGAGRRTVFSVVVLEAGVIALVGSALGFLVYLAVVAAAETLIRQRTGVVVEGWRWHPVFLWTPLGLTAVGALAGILPALKAYATQVAETLGRID